MTRRKSRPLLPHEVYSNLHSSQESGEDNVSSSFVMSSQEYLASSQNPSPDIHAKQETENKTKEEALYRDACSMRTGSQVIKPTNGMVMHDREEQQSQDLTEASVVTGVEEAENAVHSETDKKQESGSQLQDMELVESIDQANNAILDSASRSRQAHESVVESTFDDVSSTTRPEPRPLKRTSSSVRLSMSLDGKAQVVVDKNTPSPPRVPLASKASGRHFMPLQRSMSAVDIHNHLDQDIDNRTPLLSRRSTLGRSRDARTWEFYCDSDARNALTVQAEQEQKGSAQGHLRLIRSESVKSNVPPRPLSSHNTHQKQDPAKRKPHAGIHAQRPKIARTASSVARLQTVDQNIPKDKSRPSGKPSKSASQQIFFRDPSGDSDKENCEPGTQASNIRRRREPQRTNAGARRGVLQENSRLPSLSSSLGVLLDRENVPSRQRSTKRKEDCEDKENVELDAEVSAFMSEATMAREEVDLDCVQNLLSLSQAAWR